MSYNSKYTGAEVEAILDSVGTAKHYVITSFTLEDLQQHLDSGVENSSVPFDDIEAVGHAFAAKRPVYVRAADTEYPDIYPMVGHFDGDQWYFRILCGTVVWELEVYGHVRNVIGYINQIIIPTQFKTINGQSVLGSGDISVSEAESSVYIADFSAEDLYRIADGTVSHIDIDSIALEEALAANKIVLLKQASGEYADDYEGYAGTVTGYAEDLLYLNITSGRTVIYIELPRAAQSITANDIIIYYLLDREEVARVALSGNYDDLVNKPTIPAAVTESSVTNWGFAKKSYVDEKFASVSGGVKFRGVYMQLPEIDSMADQNEDGSYTGEWWHEEQLHSDTFFVGDLIIVTGVPNSDGYLFEPSYEYILDDTESPTWVPLGTCSVAEQKVIALEQKHDSQIETLTNSKQDTITDLTSIRSGASKGATAVQPADISEFLTVDDVATVATTGRYEDLVEKPTIPSAVTESTVSGWGFTKNTGTYSKPSGGIPASDLASAVQTSLGKVDAANSRLDSVESSVISHSGLISIMDTNKQDKLISGTNIKTINGVSLLGSGNLTIEGGSGGSGQRDIFVTDFSVSQLVQLAEGDLSSIPINGQALRDALDSGKIIYVPQGEDLIGGVVASVFYEDLLYLTVQEPSVSQRYNIQSSCIWTDILYREDIVVEYAQKSVIDLTININSLQYITNGYGILSFQDSVFNAWSYSNVVDMVRSNNYSFITSINAAAYGMSAPVTVYYDEQGAILSLEVLSKCSEYPYNYNIDFYEQVGIIECRKTGGVVDIDDPYAAISLNDNTVYNGGGLAITSLSITLDRQLAKGATIRFIPEFDFCLEIDDIMWAHGSLREVEPYVIHELSITSDNSNNYLAVLTKFEY